MKLIPITKGFTVMVDDEDFEHLNKYKWCAVGGKYAARRKTTSKGVQSMVYMHREILKTPIGMHTDHKNGNRFDNRKSNLRACSKAENSIGYRKKINGSSKFIGVSWNKEKSKWEAYASFGKKRRKLGYFNLEVDAAFARDKAVLERNNEFYHLNLPDHQSRLKTL